MVLRGVPPERATIVGGPTDNTADLRRRPQRDGLSEAAPSVVAMTERQTRWTAEHVLSLAPDASSRRAAAHLAQPGPWSETGTGQEAVWGLCRGSGRSVYQTAVDLTGPAYRCSCPSRKFPCKHALGLLLRHASGEAAVPTVSQPPSWAAEWLRQRRQRSGGQGAATAGASRRAASPSPATVRRRMRRITAGVTELEQRLTDLLRGGLAGADQPGYAPWGEMAARMVDAQAQGLAARIRELETLPATGPGWPERLLAECALLHLLAQGVLRLDELPEPLAATVRSRVGITTGAAALLADPAARVRDRWQVLAQYDTDEGRLLTRRIWLLGQRSRRPALLLSFGAAGRAPELSLPVGRVLDADLAYYPGARPLRAALGDRHGAPERGAVPAGVAVAAALAAYGAALCEDPWLESWPVVLSPVVVVPGDGPDAPWQVADAHGEDALPLSSATAPRGLWRLAALSGGRPLTVFGECGHRGFLPLTAWDESGEAVSL